MTHLRLHGNCCLQNSDKIFHVCESNTNIPQPPSIPKTKIQVLTSAQPAFSEFATLEWQFLRETAVKRQRTVKDGHFATQTTDCLSLRNLPKNFLPADLNFPMTVIFIKQAREYSILQSFLRSVCDSHFDLHL